MQFRSKRNELSLQSLFGLAWLIAVLGCSGGADERTVTGVVKYGGKPVYPASVRFHPPAGRAIGATVQEDGSFSAALAIGSYKVVVMPGMNIPPGWQEGQPLPAEQPMVPTPYRSDKTTPLTVTVEPGRGAVELPEFALAD